MRTQKRPEIRPVEQSATRGLRRPALVAAALAWATVCFGATAAADEFDDKARDAVPVPSRAGLATVLWLQVGDCAGEAGFARRQCEAVRQAQLERRRDQVFLVRGDAASVELGEWDDKKRSIEYRVRSCVACKAAVGVEGQDFFVVGAGKLAADADGDGDGLRAPVVFNSTLVFDDRAAADAWRTTVFPRLRTELLVELSPRNPAFSQDGKRGARVQVLGFRAFDPCTGELLAAKPDAAKLPPDSRACKATQARAPAPVDSSLPIQHSAFAINNAMAPVREAAGACLDTHGEKGTAKLQVTVDSAGTVTAVQVGGDLAGSPTGACLEQAARAVTFPPMQRPSMTFSYPVDVR